jgi:hypothetical protein
MEKKAAKTQARLKWEAACERLSFALDPPEGSSADSLDLEEAVRLAQAALQGLQAAFSADSAAAPGGDTTSRPAAGDESG